MACALEVGVSMEAAEKNAKELKCIVAKSKSKQPCYRCGRSGHGNQVCHFCDAKCHKCEKLGHIASSCHSTN